VVSTADKVIGREVFLHGDSTSPSSRPPGHPGAGGTAGPHPPDRRRRQPVGTITIPALKRGLLQTATAIEPHPHNLRLLRANIALNGLEDRVTVLAQAVGDRSGVTLHLHESATNSGNHSIGAEGIPVASSRLDDLDLPSAPSLLWMDIEGYEGHALKGASRMLAAGIAVVCEFNPTFLEQSEGMSALLQSLQDYRIYDLEKPSKETSLAPLSQHLAGGLRYTDILALPKN